MPGNAHMVPLQGEPNVGEGFCQRKKRSWCKMVLGDRLLVNSSYCVNMVLGLNFAPCIRTYILSFLFLLAHNINIVFLGLLQTWMYLFVCRTISQLCKITHTHNAMLMPMKFKDWILHSITKMAKTLMKINMYCFQIFTIIWNVLCLRTII